MDYGLFIITVRTSNCIALNDRIISTLWPNRGTIPAFVWTDFQKKQKALSGGTDKKTEKPQ
jgi:hypothetical protein